MPRINCRQAKTIKIKNFPIPYGVLVNSSNSTNAECKKINEAASFFVWSRRQTRGRGSLDKSWLDFGKSNIFLSICLKAKADELSVFDSGLLKSESYNLSMLTILAGYSIRKLLAGIDSREDHKSNYYIKWPNDIIFKSNPNETDKGFFDYLKIAGILCESLYNNDTPDYIIIGIGINLSRDLKMYSQRHFELVSKGIEKSEGYRPGFLRELSPPSERGFSKGKIIKKAIESLSKEITDYFRKGKEYRLDTINKINESLLWLNEAVTFIPGTVEKHENDRTGFELVRGILQGIDMSGAISILDPKTGKVQKFLSGSLRPGFE